VASLIFPTVNYIFRENSRKIIMPANSLSSAKIYVELNTGRLEWVKSSLAKTKV